MSQARSAHRPNKPSFSGMKKESASGPPLLSFTPTNNYASWRRSYLIRAKTEYGIVGDALAAKAMPDFEALLDEVTLTGSYTAKKPNPEARRSSIYGFGPVRDTPVPFTQAPAAGDVYTEFPDDEPFSELNPLASPARAPSPSRESAQLKKMLDEADAVASQLRASAPVLTKAQEIVLAGKIKRIQDAETMFQNALPKLCGDIMTHISDTAASRIRNHKYFERTWNSNNAVELMQIIEDCSVVAPHDLERRIKTITTARDGFYQFNRTLESYTEEFDEFERQLVLLGRPTLESQLVLNYLDHLHPSYANTITLLRTADKLPRDYEGVKQTIKSHESNARAQASSMKGGNGAQTEKQDTALAATPGKQNKGKGKGKGSAPKPTTAVAATDAAKTQPKPQTKSEASDLIECAFCKKWGKHTAQECNQLKAFRDKNPARTVSAVVIDAPTSHSGDDIVLASVAALSGEDMYDSDEVPGLLSDSADSSDDESVRRPLTSSARPAVSPVHSDSESVPGLISDSDDSSDDDALHARRRGHRSAPVAPAQPVPRRSAPSTRAPPRVAVDDDSDDDFFPSVSRSVRVQTVTDGSVPTVTASVSALAAQKSQSSKLKPGVLCLDNACTTNVVKDRHLLRNIRTIPARTLQGLGVSSTTVAGDLNDFGFALFVPSCPFNLWQLYN